MQLAIFPCLVYLHFIDIFFMVVFSYLFLYPSLGKSRLDQILIWIACMHIISTVYVFRSFVYLIIHRPSDIRLTSC
jgi:hypothetical protein